MSNRDILKEYIESLESVVSSASKLSVILSPSTKMKRWRLFLFSIVCGFNASTELEKMYNAASDTLLTYASLLDKFPDFENYAAEKEKNRLST